MCNEGGLSNERRFLQQDIVKRSGEWQQRKKEKT